MRQARGFTLAELLICIAILAEIATFTIPKILSAQQQSTKIAVFRDSLSTLMAVLHNGKITGNIRDAGDSAYVLYNVNALKICPSNSSTQGCWTHGSIASEYNEPGVLLINGVTVAGINVAPGQSGEGFYMDWNGPAGPNIEGEDILGANMCFGPSNCAGQRPDTIAPWAGASTTLWNTIFN